MPMMAEMTTLLPGGSMPALPVSNSQDRAGASHGASARCSSRARPGPDDPAPVFVRPELAVEVSFLGWEGGRLRHPAYSGLRQLL